MYVFSAVKILELFTRCERVFAPFILTVQKATLVSARARLLGYYGALPVLQ